MCSCPGGMEGNAFIQCRPLQSMTYTLKYHPMLFELNCIYPVVPVNQKPCYPSPCGPNSQCRERNGQAVCSCVLGYIGSPPTCRPECVQNSECPQNEACSNQKCRDPCPGTCGVSAKCQVVNHNPICSCLVRYTGDPFNRCQAIGTFFCLIA